VSNTNATGVAAASTSTTSDSTGFGCSGECDPEVNNDCEYSAMSAGGTICTSYPYGSGLLASGMSTDIVFEQVEIPMCSETGSPSAVLSASASASSSAVPAAPTKVSVTLPPGAISGAR